MDVPAGTSDIGAVNGIHLGGRGVEDRGIGYGLIVKVGNLPNLTSDRRSVRKLKRVFGQEELRASASPIARSQPHQAVCLRKSGGVTAMPTGGATTFDVMDQSGHCRVETLREYNDQVDQSALRAVHSAFGEKD